MQYYSWSISNNYPERLMLKFEGPYMVNKLALTSERRLNLAYPIEFSTRCKRGRETILLYDQIVTTVGLAVSPTFAEVIIEELSDNEIELLDTVISTDTGKLRSYRLLNILNKVDVLDRERTEFAPSGNRQQTVLPQRCVYDQSKLRGFDIGRVKGSSTILLSENFVEVVKQKKFAGFAANPIDPEQISYDNMSLESFYAMDR